jgi:hypothetical protein
VFSDANRSALRESRALAIRKKDTMQTQHRLDDILARDITIQWFEGTALVQAVCEQVLTHGRADAFPSAADIAVDADGSIGVLGYSAGLPVVAAGHLLAGMAGDDVPVRLRLAINEATAAESPYKHLAAFSEALAYFERPGRRELIAAVYARATAAPSRSVARSRQSPAPEIPKQQWQEARPRRRRRALAPALLVAGAVVAAAIWLAPNHSQVSAALSTLVADAPSEKNLAPAEAIGVPSAQPHHPPKKVKVRAREERPTPPVKTGEDSRLPARRDVPPNMVFDDVLLVFASEPGEEANDRSGGDTGSRVYSRDDGLVSPPRPVRPQLPPEPPFDPTVAPATELELVIGASGLVQSAKLKTPPRNVNEFMLVSAAKAWIFQPAELDGRPVAYRHRVRLILP